MRVYRIRRKDSGQLFCYWKAPWNPRYAGQVCWSDTGTFFRTIDTIENHLRLLCSDWHPSGRTRFKDVPVIDSYHPDRLSLYEIVCNDVSIHGEEVIQATDLVKEKAAS